MRLFAFYMALSEDDYKKAADELGCEVACIRAVADVESKGGAYLPDGRPQILFEAHKFSYYTKGRFDGSHPHISSPEWNKKLYRGGAAEWGRLEEAIELDRKAALMSASWGRFQIMGFNFAHAGFTNVEDFIAAIKESEQENLAAFVELIKSFGLADELQRHDWAKFARIYNGPGAVAQYSERLDRAYDKFSKEDASLL